MPSPTIPHASRQPGLSRRPVQAIQAAVLALTLLQFAPLAQAAEPPPIKPGLWEITTENQMIDGKPLPDLSAQMAEQLKKMPPEMRKQMEAHMKARGLQMSASDGRAAVRMCLTSEMLTQDRWQKTEGHCQNTAMNRSGATWTWKFKCTQPPGEGEGTTTFQGSEGYVSDMRVTSQREGKPHQITMKHRGKWLGADCGGLKPMTPPTPTPQPVPPTKP